jgi:hypothetical protein
MSFGQDEGHFGAATKMPGDLALKNSNLNDARVSSKGAAVDKAAVEGINRFTAANNDSAVSDYDLREIHDPVLLTPGPFMSTEDDVQDLLDPRHQQRAKRTLDTAKNLFAQITDSSEGLFAGAWSLLSGLFKQAATANPALLTWGMGIWSCVAGVFGISHVFNVVRQLFGNARREETSWLIRAGQAILWLGSAAATGHALLGSPNNPLTKIVDGQAVVPLGRLLGSMLAPLIVAEGVSASEGTSFINKLPVLKDLGDVLMKMSQGISYYTSSDYAPVRGEAAQAAGAPQPAMARG